MGVKCRLSSLKVEAETRKYDARCLLNSGILGVLGLGLKYHIFNDFFFLLLPVFLHLHGQISKKHV